MNAKIFDGQVVAHCPDCQAITTFENRHDGKPLSCIIKEKDHDYAGTRYLRILYAALRCASCHRIASVKIHDKGHLQFPVIEEFYPISVENAILPSEIPKDILKEFREAERCAAFGANRGSSALFRSVLEKILKANGYNKGNLKEKINAAAKDGILTNSRQMRAHENIRDLGNDVLHEESWRVVSDQEVEDSHHYAQRIIEDFYDDRKTVEKILIEKGKLNPPNGLKIAT